MINGGPVDQCLRRKLAAPCNRTESWHLLRSLRARRLGKLCLIHSQIRPKYFVGEDNVAKGGHYSGSRC